MSSASSPASLVGEATNPVIRWEWVVEEWDQIWDAIVEHVILTMLAMSLGLVVSAILAAIALRHRWTLEVDRGAAARRLHPADPGDQHRRRLPGGPTIGA